MRLSKESWLLGIVAALMVSLLIKVFYDVRQLHQEGSVESLGLVLMGFGLIFITAHRRLGATVYKRGIALRARIARPVWTEVGERTAQKLYLMVGFVTLVAGLAMFLAEAHRGGSSMAIKPDGWCVDCQSKGL